MKVEIEVNGEVLNKLIEKELDCIKPEDVRGVAIQCIHECLAENDYAIVKRLLVNENYYNHTNTPTAFTEGILKSCDYSKLQDVVDKIILTLTEDYRDILKDILLDAIVNGLMDKYAVNTSLRNIINREIYINRTQ